MLRFVVPVWIGIGFCLVSTPGHAFNRAKNSAGKELFWPRTSTVAVVKLHIQQPGLGDYFAANPKLGSPESEVAAIQAAFFAWTAVTCSDARPVGLSVVFQGRLANAKVGYDSTCTGCNQSVVVFVRGRGAWRHNEQVLSKTTVTSNPTTGAILDADIEINATGKFAFSTQVRVQENIRWDLQNIMTHEAGKFLGLAESSDPKSTMAAKTSSGDLSLRSLETDDINGICTIYPPDPNAAKIPTYQQTKATRDLGCSSVTEAIPSLSLGFFLLLLFWGYSLRFRSTYSS